MYHSHSAERGLQQEAKKIIKILKSKNVPQSEELNYFTVGDHFRYNVLKLELELLDLTSAPGALERRVLGDFGTGKTHFLSYLEWLLQRDAPSSCVISRVDMSDLREPNDLQFLIIQGMQPVRGGNYAQVLRDAYIRVRKKYMAEYGGVTQRDIERVFGTVLFLILGKVTGGWVSRDVLNILASDPLDRLIKYLSGDALEKLFQQARRNANKVHIEFVDKYLDMIRNLDAPITAFESPARKLSFEGNLTDVIFKVLAWDDFDTVVILIDELESLRRFEQTILQQSCVALRVFRDTLDDASRRNYPSVALVCASTDQFFEEQLKAAEPALYSRWEDRDEAILLNPLSAADIDALIFKLRDLYYLAGHYLRPVECFSSDESGIEHEVTKMRTELLLSEYTPETLTARRLISRLIKDIEKTWLSGTPL